MLFHLIVGAAATVVFIVLFQRYSDVSIGGWILTVLALLYSVLVLEIIYGFAVENEPQAALVMGLVTGIVAVIWWVLLVRFAFAKTSAPATE